MRTKAQQLAHVNKQIAKIEKKEKLAKDLEVAKNKLANLRIGKPTRRR